MGITIRISGDSLAERLYADRQLEQLNLEVRAFDGEEGIGTYVHPDPSGADDYKGHRELVILQDDGAGPVTIFDGFLGDQTRTREFDPTRPQREHIFQAADGNALAHGFRFHASRPEETVEERWLWALGQYRPQWLTDWILDTDPVTLPAKQYDGTGFDDLIADTVSCGKTFFVHSVKDGSGDRCAHMHRFTEGHPCGLSIDDTIRVNRSGDTFNPIRFPARTHSPTILTNEIYARDQAGRVVVLSDGTSIADHNADGMAHDAVVEFDAESQADLQRQAEQMLTEHKLEQQTYEVHISRLDADAMSKWNEGDLIDVTSEVLGLPGTVSPIRIAHARFYPSRDRNDRPMWGLWDVEMELGSPMRSRRDRGKARPISPFQRQPLPSWTAVMNTAGGEGEDTDPTVTIDVPGGHNVRLVYEWTMENGALDTVGWASGQFITEIDGGGLEYLPNIHSVAVAGTSTEEELCWNGGTNTYCSTQDIVGAGKTQPSPTVIAPVHGLNWTLTVHGIRHNVEGFGQWDVASTLEVTLTDIVDETTGLSLLSQAVAQPKYGQPVADGLTGDGTTTLFTVDYPYVPGSVVATVDGDEWVVTETDPTAGTITFATAPPVGAVIVVRYAATGADPTGTDNGAPPASSPASGVTDHGALTGLADDDHPQYLLGNEGEQGEVFAHGAMGATETFDPTDGNLHTGTLDANLTVTLSAPPSTRGGSPSYALIELWFTGSGTNTITWPGSVVWTGGTEPDPPGNGEVARYVLETIDGGTTWYGAAVGGGGGSALTVENEGSALATAADTLDFVGPLVTASGTGAEKTITVTGALDDLTDVTITSPAAAQRLRYNGSAWVNTSLIWKPVTTYDGTNWLPAVDGDGNAIITEA